MNRGVKLLILLLVLGLACGGAFFLTKKGAEEVETEPVDESIALTDENSVAVTRLAWRCGGRETLEFVLEDGTWVQPADRDFPVDQSFMESVLENFANVKASTSIEAAGDLADYGLKDPFCSFEMTGAKEYRLSIGDVTPLGSERYASVGDGKIYLIGKDVVSCIDHDRDEMLAYESFTEAEQLLEVRIKGARDFDLYYDSPAYMLDDGSGKGAREVDGDMALRYLSVFTGLYWLSCEDYTATKAELAQYGLDEPELEADFTYYDTEGNFVSETLLIGNVCPEDVMESAVYAMIKGSDMIYTLDDGVRNDLLHTMYEDFATE